METISRKPDTQFNGQDLPWLIEQYLEDCARRVKKHTLYTYQKHLEYFLTWWAEVGPTQNYIMRRSDFNVFLQWLQTQSSYRTGPLAFGTIFKTLVLVKQVLKYAHREGYTTRDYAVWVPKVKGKPLPRQAPDPACIAKLFEACNVSLHPVRNKALLAVLIGTAVRRNECVNIDIGDVKFFADKPGGQIMIRQGKGNKDRIVFFDEIAADYIAAQITYLAEIGHTEGALFVGYTKTRMHGKSLNGVIDRLVETAGLSDVVHGPHDLRRMFATEWLRRNKSEGSAQLAALQMGHTDPKMTILYSKPTIDDVEKNFTSPMKAVDE